MILSMFSRVVVAIILIYICLRERQQVVKVRNSFSVPRTEDYGVPQGCVLGPFMFVIFVNILFSRRAARRIVTFGDDKVVFK